jgi:hypothetical protein
MNTNLNPVANANLSVNDACQGNRHQRRHEHDQEWQGLAWQWQEICGEGQHNR